MSALLLLLACSGGASGGASADGAATPSAAGTARAAQTGGASAAQTGGASGDITDAHVVAKWDGGQITYGDLKADISTQLAQLEVEYLQNRYRTQQQAAEGSGIRAVVAAEAKSRGMSEEELISAEVEEKITSPTDAEVEEFYPVVKRQLRNAPLDKVRDQVEAALMDRRKGERLQVYIDELRSKYGLEIDVPYPDLPRIDMPTDGDPSVGPEDARVTIIEFGDYQCGYCAKAFSTVQRIHEKYPDDVRVVYRDFPLSFHPRAIPAAVAANCVGEVGGDGKYWEMHDALMQNQSALGDEDLEATAEGLGVDMGKWQACMDAKDKQLEEIQGDFEAGSAAGVSGTPAFFINGIFLSGAQPFEQFEAIISRELGG